MASVLLAGALAISGGSPVVWAPQPGSQTVFLGCPIYEALYEGTRGASKTDALLMDFAKDVGVGYGAAWRGVLFRETYKQLDDVVTRSKRWFYRIFPGARFLGSNDSYKWVWPTGEELLFRVMSRPDDYWDYHGHEYPWIGWEELCNWPSLECYASMKACSRSSVPGVPRRIRATTNPFGIGHHAVKAFFIDPAPPGVVMRDELGLERVRIHGHWSENKILLAAEPDYPAKIAASCDGNENRMRAWLHGDWDIVAGGFFDDVWDRPSHVVQPFAIPSSWYIDRSFDWGSSKPFSVGWWAESDGTTAPNGKTYPRGTLFRIAEFYGWDGKHPDVGCKKTSAEIAKEIVSREKLWKERFKWRIHPGPADSSIFDVEDGHSIAAGMKTNKVEWTEADKSPGSRHAGWERIRGLLLAATKRPMEAPGLFVFDTCTHFIRTVPVLPRDDKDPEDVDTDAEDHIGDETRYRVLAKRQSKAMSTGTFHAT